MTSTPTRLMTADEFFCMPDDGKLYELVDGKLEEVGAASPRSSAVAALIVTLINVFVLRHKLGVVGGADWGTKLFSNPDTVRAPDVCFVRRERLPGGRVPVRFQDGVPDLLVEVLSPSDRYRKVARKVREYLAAGARLVWIIDPEERSAVVYRADGSQTDYDADGILDGEDVLPGFTLNLAEIWLDAADEPPLDESSATE